MSRPHGELGRGGRAWQRLRQEIFARGEPCCRCGEPIDYDLPHLDALGNREPRSATLDHFPYPLSTHPHLALSPENLHPAHAKCNDAGRPKPVVSAAGSLTSREW